MLLGNLTAYEEEEGAIQAIF